MRKIKYVRVFNAKGNIVSWANVPEDSLDDYMSLCRNDLMNRFHFTPTFEVYDTNYVLDDTSTHSASVYTKEEKLSNSHGIRIADRTNG